MDFPSLLLASLSTVLVMTRILRAVVTSRSTNLINDLYTTLRAYVHPAARPTVFDAPHEGHLIEEQLALGNLCVGQQTIALVLHGTPPHPRYVGRSVNAATS